MGQGRGRTRCALWGGIALGVGTLLFALFSSSSAGCSTNVVVLTHSIVTARGCAAFSVVSHIGIGLIVLGAVLLLGSFALTVRARRQSAVSAASNGAAPTPTPTPSPPPAASIVVEPAPVQPVAAPVAPSTSHVPPTPDGPVPSRGGTATEPPVAAPSGPGPVLSTGPYGPVVRLPPGWYGNPNIPGGPVQWWDGEKLTDRPE